VTIGNQNFGKDEKRKYFNISGFGNRRSKEGKKIIKWRESKGMKHPKELR
jgi:hypothetical protein